MMEQTFMPDFLGMTALRIEEHIDDITAFLEAGGIGPFPRDQHRVLFLLQCIWWANPEMHEEWSR